MSMLEGVSQCWWLSNTCVVNWDAWAAIGTVAAVFAAVLAPVMQRWLTRINANAMFALAYREDLFMAKAQLERICSQFPFFEKDVAWAVQAMLEREGKARARFLALSGALDGLTSRDIDMTKWPAVDLALAATVAMARESVRTFQIGAELFANPLPDRNWGEMMESMSSALKTAIDDVNAANGAVASAVGRLRRKPGLSIPWLHG